MLALTIKLLRDEQALKTKYGKINIVESDIEFTNRNLVILSWLGIMVGIMAGALRLGGGVIFNPVLLTMGLPP